MKFRTWILCSLVILFLTTGLANAGETTKPSVPLNPVTDLNPSSPGKPCLKGNMEIVGWEGSDFQLPYILQQTQKACLDKCTQEFDSCMSGAGENPSAQFRCGEKKWMCTRSCDNQFAPQLEL